MLKVALKLVYIVEFFNVRRTKSVSLSVLDLIFKENLEGASEPKATYIFLIKTNSVKVYVQSGFEIRLDIIFVSLKIKPLVKIKLKS